MTQNKAPVRLYFELPHGYIFFVFLDGESSGCNSYLFYNRINFV